MLRGKLLKFKKPTLKITKDVQIHNRFDILLRNQKTGETRKVAQAFNLITDQWWERYAQGNQFSYIAYGDGAGTPNASDTSLFSRVGAMEGINTVLDISKYWTDGYFTYQKNITIPAGTETGVEFTEVGISYDGTSGHLVTHAMIEDMNGNTISIIKGADDDLIIYATVFVYFELLGYEGGGVKFGYISGYQDLTTSFELSILKYFAGVETYSKAVNTVNGLWAYEGTPPIMLGPKSASENWQGHIGIKSSVFTESWDELNKTFKFEGTARINGTDLNPSSGFGIMGLALGSSSTWGGIELRICLPIDGLGGQGVGEDNLGYVPISHLKDAGGIGTGDASEVDFRTPYPFIKDDGSFKIYFDGVEESAANYSVDFDKPPTTNIGLYFNRIEGNYPLLGCSLIADSTPPNGLYEISENPYYATYGIQSFYRSDDTALKVETSNDLINWTPISGNGTVSVPVGQQNDRYWRAEVINNPTNDRLDSFITTDLTDLNNIHFNTAPGSGVVLTHDARYLCIPKDTNTYFDISVDIILAEKV